MKKLDTGTKNIGFYSGMLAAHVAAMPMVNGALMQLVLADKGLDMMQISVFSTAVQMTTLIGTMVCSKLADRIRSPLLATQLILAFQTLLYILYIPAEKAGYSPVIFLRVVMGLAVVQTASAALKGVLDYKLPYQIVPLEKYGGMIFFNSAINGVVGIALSFCFSQIIAVGFMGQPYLWCMGLALGLLTLSLVCSYLIRPLQAPNSLDRRSGRKSPKLLELFKSPQFRAIIIPTMLRGVTFGITGSMVLIMLNLGYTEADASRLPILTACGCLLAAGAYQLLRARLRLPNIGLIGGAMMLAAIFLPRGNTLLFFALYLLVYTGQVLIDCTVPIMIIQIIDPETAGAFNAWRNTLLFLVSTATTYLTGVLLAKGWVTVLLVACATAYFASMFLHKKVYDRFSSPRR